MEKESQREDLDHKPENAEKVGQQHKQTNQEGEKPRSPDSKDENQPV